jgi:hypothetical protein
MRQEREFVKHERKEDEVRLLTCWRRTSRLSIYRSVLSPFTNTFHWSVVKTRTGPALFFESLVATVLPTNATSTH